MIMGIQGFPFCSPRLRSAGAALLLALCAPQLPAAVLIVTAAGDSQNFADGCSLREAIVNAETASRQGSLECASGDSGPDTIILPPSAISVGSSTVEESNPAVGDLDITTDITILGSGQQFSVIDIGFSGRLFDVHPGAKLTLSGTLLSKGYADEVSAGAAYGATIRVAGSTGALAGEFIGDDIGIESGRIASAALDGRGAGIYGGPLSFVTVTRSLFMFNEATLTVAAGVDSGGAGLYCDGCVLALGSSTFAQNSAGKGAGLYLAMGSDAALEFVTLGYNVGESAAGLYNNGVLDFSGSISADNTGGLDVDLLCGPDGALTAQYSFVEFPAAACPALAGLNTRANSLATGSEPKVLRKLTEQLFDNQPSRVLRRNIGPPAVPAVPAAQCTGHVDQWGAPAVNAPVAPPASTDAGCASGAHEMPLIGINPMMARVTANGPDAVLNVGVLTTLTAPATLRVRKRGDGGIGESCDFPDVDIPLSAGGGDTLSIDPDTLFLTPSLARRQRVCELEGVLISPEAHLNGANTGVIRVRFDDGLSGAAGGLTLPKPGGALQFGTVPVGDRDPLDGRDGGGDSSIFFYAQTEALQIDSATITGVGAAKFAINSTFPITVPVAPASGVPLSLRCLGGELGYFDAVLQVNATRLPPLPEAPEALTLVYGLTCTVAHLVTLSASPYFGQVGEADGLNLNVEIRLDSPNMSGGPISLDLYHDGGTATPDDDFEFLEPWPLTVTIPADSGEASVSFGVFDDEDEFGEGTETIVVRAELAPHDNVVLSGSNSVTLGIVDNDIPETDVMVELSGVPSVVNPGSQVRITVAGENISDLQWLSGVQIGVDVAGPARVLSFLVTEVQVSCEKNKAHLVATIEDPDALAAALAREACLDGEMVSSLPKDTDNDGDFDTPAYSLPLKLVSGSFCSIPAGMGTGSCGFRDQVPPGTRVLASALVLTAEMASAPQLDFPATMTARFAGNGGGPRVATDSSSYILNGREGVQTGGGLVGLPPLLFVGLLALRARRKRSTGRKPG